MPFLCLATPTLEDGFSHPFLIFVNIHKEEAIKEHLIISLHTLNIIGMKESKQLLFYRLDANSYPVYSNTKNNCHGHNTLAPLGYKVGDIHEQKNLTYCATSFLIPYCYDGFL